MKKLLLTTLLFAFAAAGFSQGTYYWVAGTTASNLTSGSSWNTQQDGLGSSRVANVGDVLIIDGANIGGTSPTTGVATIIVNGATTAQVKIQNGANVVLVRLTSTGTLTLANNTVGQPGLLVDATSSLQICNQDLTGTYSGAVYLDFPTSTAIINGTIKIVQGTAIGNPRMTSRTAGSIVFTSGASLEYSNTSGYPFSTVGVATSNSVNFAFVFQSGASLICESIYSPFGSSSTNSIVDFRPGSNYYVRRTMTTGSITNQKTFANVFIQNGATLTTDAAALNKIENLTVDAGCNLNVGISSSTPLPITGNLVVNGNINGATPGTFLLIMGGNSPQSISGSGSINVSSFIVANHANVVLNKDISVASAVNVYGSLNLNTHQINGDASFSSRVNFEPPTVSQGGSSVTEGSYQVNIALGLALSTLPGLSITGSGIPANTNIVSYSSANGQINLSQPATATGSNVTLTFGSNVSTLATSNTNGIDGNILVTGTKNFTAGTNYVFNAATSAPFPASSTNAVGDLNINAAVTTNINATVNGNITLTSAKLTIAEGNELTVAPTTTFNGVSANSYLVTTANTGTGGIGIVKIAGLSASKLFPIGSPTNYLPVTLVPVNSSDFTLNAFQGATANAQPNGTALTAPQKLEMVDAVWNVNRTAGTGDATISFAWPDALEGANFVGPAGLGVSQYTTSYSSFTGTASSTTNTASVTAANDALGGFIVGKTTTLPVTLISFTAKAVNQTTVLNWKTTSEVNLSHYLVQRSNDGVSFETLSTISANNKVGVFNYGFIDKSPAFGANYYQLISVDIDGTEVVSKIEAVNFGSVISLSVYPNPTKGNVNIAGLTKGDVIKITDLVGRTLKTQTYDGEDVLNLNLDNVNIGVYLISVSKNGKVLITSRIVKN
ncbi:beta strand repeat-containing protein [Pedobacter alpinus]|uniref:Beta strand repeat-containing protein n=1 Tax=Pedobacter alpinus TaxID=1590643 RepID=A0ABW5TY56_9SPHI